MRRHRVLSPKGVKKNDLKNFLTNGFKVSIIYIQKQNRMKVTEQRKKLMIELRPINNPSVAYPVRRHVKNAVCSLDILRLR